MLHLSSSNAEAGVISGILRKPDKMHEVLGILKPIDFIEVGYRQIFESMVRLHERGKPIDAVLLMIDLKENKSIVNSELIANTVSYIPGREVILYAKKVKEMSIRRMWVDTGKALISKANDMAVGIDELASRAGGAIDGIVLEAPGEASQDYSAVVSEMLDNVVQGIIPKKILTNYSTLNDLTGGFHGGEMITLAGRPGTGKTALALNIAIDALISGKSVGIFSLEMSQTALTERMCSTYTGVNAQKFRTRRFEKSDMELINKFHAETVNTFRCKIYDKMKVTVETIGAECKKWQNENSLDLVIIDYLQLVEPSVKSKDNNREREVAEISRNVKRIATELNIPVLLLAQLNRRVESDKDKRPRLSDLRESGSIEQDSDMVLFITPWDIADTKRNHAAYVELVIAKSRNSMTGVVGMEYIRSTLTFNETIVQDGKLSKYAREQKGSGHQASNDAPF